MYSYLFHKVTNFIFIITKKLIYNYKYALDDVILFYFFFVLLIYIIILQFCIVETYIGQTKTANSYSCSMTNLGATKFKLN